MKKTLPRRGPDQNLVFVKRHAGQRLYRPATDTCLTRGDVMSESGEKFVVIDAGKGNDVTLLYHPFIVEH